MPAELLYGMVVFLKMCERAPVATVLLVCFAGLLRVSEALRLPRRDLIMGNDYVVLVLDRTKRGQNEKVVIKNLAVVTWLARYLRTFPTENHEAAFPVSYGTVSRWMKRAAEALGFGELNLTTHSLRRGGATQLLRLGVSYQDIALFGRWASESSVRHYLREGEVMMTRASHSFSEEKWNIVARLGACHDAVWH